MKPPIRLPLNLRTKDPRGDGEGRPGRALLSSAVVVHSSATPRFLSRHSLSFTFDASPVRDFQAVLCGVGGRSRNNPLRSTWILTMRNFVFREAGFGTVTGGAEEAAHPLSYMGWSDATWATRTSQVSK